MPGGALGLLLAGLGTPGIKAGSATGKAIARSAVVSIALFSGVFSFSGHKAFPLELCQGAWEGRPDSGAGTVCDRVTLAAQGGASC